MRRRDQISLAFGGAALLVATLVVGGALRWTQALVAALVASALALQIPARRRLSRISPLLVVIGVAITLTMVQLIPIGTTLNDVLDPTGNALRTEGAALAHTSPWSCISLDPAGTLQALAFFLSLFGVALLSLRFAAQEGGTFVLLSGVALTCGLVAGVTALHMVVGADSLYGIYTPLHAAPHAFGPLLNSNHLGCLMAFGCTLSVGLAFYEPQLAHWRALWVVVAIGCASLTLVSLSRGATVSLVLGLGSTMALLVAQRLRKVGRKSRSRSNQLPIAIVVVTGLALAVYTSAGNVADQLVNTSMTEVDTPVSKFAAWKTATELVAESPWVGIGRGAIESTFTRIFEPGGHVTFSHLENEYVEAVVDWGIPGAIALALALGWCVFEALRRWRSGPLVAGALGAMVGVMFQSSVDFGIELLGVAVPVTIVAATLQRSRLNELPRRGLKLGRIAVVCAITAGAVVLLRPVSYSVQEDHDTLADSSASFQDLLDASERHPLDYFAFGRLAEEMIELGDRHAVTYLNHALLLHPFHPGLHRLAARLLAERGHKDQAALEYSLAIHGTLRPYPLLAEVLTTLPLAPDAAKAIPLDYVNPEVILRSLHEFKRDDVAEAWLADIVDHGTDNLSIIDELYTLASDRRDLDVALKVAARRLAVSNTATSHLMHARVLFKLHDLTEVLDELRNVADWPGRIDQHAEAWLIVCDAYTEQAKWDRALECVHRLDASGLIQSWNRDGIVKREEHIRDLRATEINTKQIQDLERSMNLPVDSELPVISSHAIPAPTPIRPTGDAIQNPLIHHARP